MQRMQTLTYLQTQTLTFFRIRSLGPHFLLYFRASGFETPDVTAVCRAFASARKTSQKPEKTLISEKSPCQRTKNALIHRFLGNKCSSGLLRRFLRLPEHPAKESGVSTTITQKKRKNGVRRAQLRNFGWRAAASKRSAAARPFASSQEATLILHFSLSLFLSLPPAALVLFLSLCIVRVSLLTHTHIYTHRQSRSKLLKWQFSPMR